jgi:hypothetical protein
VAVSAWDQRAILVRGHVLGDAVSAPKIPRGWRRVKSLYCVIRRVRKKVSMAEPRVPRGWKRVTRGLVRRGDEVIAGDLLNYPQRCKFVAASLVGVVGERIGEFVCVIRRVEERRRK